jgi:hypothetical protein
MKKIVVLFTVLALVVSVHALTVPQSLTVVNGSFEDPDTAGGEYDNGLGGFPGWTEVGGSATSGHQKIITSALASDGVQIAQIRGLWTVLDTSGITQILTDTFEAGTYKLTFDGVSLGGTNAKAMILAGSDIIASDTFDLGAEMAAYSVLVTLDGSEAAIGQTIGIRLQNYAGGGGAANLIGFDNVRMDIVPEPATMALLALGGLFLRRRK